MKKVVSTLILMASLPMLSQAQEAKLCHIASAGFYATDGEKGILMDAMFERNTDRHVTASDELNDRMTKAEGEFSNVHMVPLSL